MTEINLDNLKNLCNLWVAHCKKTGLDDQSLRDKIFETAMIVCDEPAFVDCLRNHLIDIGGKGLDGLLDLYEEEDWKANEPTV